MRIDFPGILEPFIDFLKSFELLSNVTSKFETVLFFIGFLDLLFFISY